MPSGLAEQSLIYKHKVSDTLCPTGDWRKTDLAGGAPPWLLGRERGDDSFKARIAAQRVPKRQQFQSAIAEGAWVAEGGGKLFACEIFVASPRSDHREILNHERTIDCVFFDR